MHDIESHDYRRFAVLIIEPDESLRLSFRRALGEKLWILEAASDAAALELLRRQHDGVGVIVRDELLPPGAADTGALALILKLCPEAIRVLSGHESSLGKVAQALHDSVGDEGDPAGISAAVFSQTAAEDPAEPSENQLDKAILNQAFVWEGNHGKLLYITRPWDMGQLETTLLRAMELFVIGFERDLLMEERLHGGAGMPSGVGRPVPYPTVPVAFGWSADGQAVPMPAILPMPGIPMTGPVAEPAAKKPAKEEAKPGSKGPSARRPRGRRGEPVSHPQAPTPPVALPQTSPVARRKPRVAFWKKLGGGSLSLSLILHGVLVAIGVVWIFQIIPEKKPQDFIPRSDGGAPMGVKNRVQQQKRSFASRNLPRAAAKDVATGITLPEPNLALTAMTSIGKLGSGAMSAGMLGSGAGPKAGTPIFNAAMNANFAPAAPNPFGVLNPDATALVGTLYDLKQDGNRRPTELSGVSTSATSSATLEVLNEFIRRGWNEKLLSAKYYQAPRQLYLTKVFIPTMSASEAPKAFDCEKEVLPSRWAVVYRGSVRPPKNGKYRFVGAGDDVLAVRFGGKTVFDYGYSSATAKLRIMGNAERVKDDRDREWNHQRKNWTMPEPVHLYTYPSLSPSLQQEVGGLAVGLEFEAEANKDYPIEILISEIPGGLFCAYLMIEEIGATYETEPGGLPVLPIFRLDQNEPVIRKPGPPYDPNAPAWKVVPGRGGKLAI